MTVHLPENKSLVLELRRIFYSFKLSQQQTKEFSSLMITSSRPREGKTVLSLAFALGLAGEVPEKCLLVDANWMTPELHSWFSLKRSYSLSAFWKEPWGGIQPSGVDNLDVLPAPIGVEVDSQEEFVNSETLKNVYDKLKEKYNTIVFDTSSINLNINAYGYEPGLRNFDSLLLSDFVHTSILVILARKTKKQDVKKAKFALERGHHNILAVLNNYKNPFYKQLTFRA